MKLTSEQLSVANILAIEQRATVSGCLESRATAAFRTISLKNSLVNVFEINIFFGFRLP
jgi:hypothetical protein